MTAPLVRVLQASVPSVTLAADDETVLGQAEFDGAVIAVQYVPEAAITGADTDNRVVSLVNKGQDGTGMTVMATLAFATGVDAIAYKQTTIVLSATPADLTVVTGDTLVWASAHAGNGIADPGGAVHVTVSRSGAGSEYGYMPGVVGSGGGGVVEGGSRAGLFVPADYGWKGWSADIAGCAGGRNNLDPGQSELSLVRVTEDQPVVNGIEIFLAGAQSGLFLVPAQCGAALYRLVGGNTVALVMQSADITDPRYFGNWWDQWSDSRYRMPFPTPIALPAGDYWGAVWYNGDASPRFLCQGTPASYDGMLADYPAQDFPGYWRAAIGDQADYFTTTAEATMTLRPAPVSARAAALWMALY